MGLVGRDGAGRALPRRGRGAGQGALKRYGLTALRVVVSVGLMLVLLSWVSWAQAAIVLRAGLANWPLLLVAVALPGLGQVIAAVRWRILLGGLDVRPRLRRLLAATLVGSFFNLFLPSTIGGDVMRGWWVRDAVGSATRSLTVVGLDRLIGLLAFCAVGLVAAAFVPSVARDAAVIWVEAGAIVLALAILALATHPAVGRLAQPLFALPPLRRVRDKARQACEALVELRRARARLALSFGWGVVLQLNVIAQFLILAAALEVGIGLWALAVLIPIVNLITLLPVSINGFGVREAALATLGAPFGLSLEGAMLLAYAWVFFAMGWGLVGGVIYLCNRTKPPPACEAPGLVGPSAALVIHDFGARPAGGCDGPQAHHGTASGAGGR